MATNCNSLETILKCLITPLTRGLMKLCTNFGCGVAITARRTLLMTIKWHLSGWVKGLFYSPLRIKTNITVVVFRLNKGIRFIKFFITRQYRGILSIKRVCHRWASHRVACSMKRCYRLKCFTLMIYWMRKEEHSSQSLETIIIKKIKYCPLHLMASRWSRKVRWKWWRHFFLKPPR